MSTAREPASPGMASIAFCASFFTCMIDCHSLLRSACAPQHWMCSDHSALPPSPGAVSSTSMSVTPGSAVVSLTCEPPFHIATSVPRPPHAAMIESRIDAGLHLPSENCTSSTSTSSATASNHPAFASSILASGVRIGIIHRRPLCVFSERYISPDATSVVTTLR